MKNKNKRIMLMLGLIRFVFPITEKILPVLARKWANNLFFTPFRFAGSDKETEFLKTSTPFNFTYKKENIKGYEWGNGPKVLLIHGWGGRAGQFHEIIGTLVSNGYKAIAFDAPAHGQSSGKKTHILEFIEVMKLLQKQKGQFFAVIGHSLGGAALFISIKEGFEAEKIISISVPSIGDKIIDEFRNKLNATTAIHDSLKKYVNKKFNVDFDDFSVSKTVRTDFPEKEAFIIHDDTDKEAPIEHFHTLVANLPHAKTYISTGLGHNRILKDKGVIDQIVSFLGDSENEVVKNKKLNQINN